MNFPKKKICVVGAGKWGMNHIKTLKKYNCLYGVVETDRSKHILLKQKYNNIDVFDSLDDAILCNFDGYILSTPADSHFKLSSLLIKNNFPVLIEKPLALNEKDAKIIVDLSLRYKTQVMVGHVLLFHPAIIKIKELIDEGKIGKLQYIYSNRLNLGTIRSHENVFWSFAPHDISIFQYFINKFPQYINSFGGAYLQKNVHDITITNFKYPNNIKAHIYTSWLHPFKEHRLVVIGDLGMLSFEDSSIEKNIYFYSKGYEWENGIPVKKEGPTDIINYDNTKPLDNELNYFINNLNKKIIKSDVENGLEVVKILEKATKSLMGIN
ncbi:MAG: oxidoreductase [Gammaproteobacteria bacterium]|nr:oxidoreductase [Gammaproteobacteria bacterium]|tara:strand:- start:1194 stop:2165 length:972 start_codon:yes stop_codon:yes gene_type:complete